MFVIIYYFEFILQKLILPMVFLIARNMTTVG